MTTKPTKRAFANGSLEHTWLLDDDGCGTLRSKARHRGGSCGATGSVIRMADGWFYAAVRGASKRCGAAQPLASGSRSRSRI